MVYEYKMVQIPPNIVVKEKDQEGNEAAYYLQSIANKHAELGWDFYRIDTIGVVTQPGCIGALFGAKESLNHYYVVTLRRERK